MPKTRVPASDDRERSFGVLLNDRLFRASDPSVLKRTLTLDGAPKYEIFGVLPQGFDFPIRSDLYGAAGAALSFRYLKFWQSLQTVRLD